MTNNTIKFIKFDPDDEDADIEGWCKLNEIIVASRKLEGIAYFML